MHQDAFAFTLNMLSYVPQTSSATALSYQIAMRLRDTLNRVHSCISTGLM